MMQISRRKFIVNISKGIAAIPVFPLIAQAYDGSGEGHARILEPNILVAGKKTRVVIEITAGAGGIAIGGGIWVGLHHAATWNSNYGVRSSFQAENPNSEKYIGVIGKQANNFEGKWHGWAPGESMNRAPGGPPANDWSGSTPLIFHQCLQAKVKNTSIKPGEKILVEIGNIEYGATAPISTDIDHEFFVAIDSTGEGVFKGIGGYPKIDLVAAEPNTLTGSAQMIQESGVPFELHVKAEDKYNNTAKSFNGKVNVLSEQGDIIAKDIILNKGMARTMITIPKAGPQRLRLNGPGIQGRTEPIIVFDKAPNLRIYVGDIHGHTRVSDGCGQPDEYYLFGRDEANIDVCALSDHWHYDWDLMKRMVKKYYQSGRFVTLLAEEDGTNLDHFNVYHQSDDTPHTSRFPKSYEDHYKILEEEYLNKGHKVLGGPHHFAFDRGEKCYPWEKWDPRFARFAEIYSNHGTSEYEGNPNPLHTTDPDKTMQAGLAKGKRFGVIAASDTHVSHPGRSNWLQYRGALAAFLAPKLDRQSIWDALWNYRVYAMSFDRVYIDFKINGQIMGSEVKTHKNCQVNFEVVGRDEPMEVILLRNNEKYRKENSSNGIVKVSFEDSLPTDENFYYLRITQQNKERAWSTPIWVQRT